MGLLIKLLLWLTVPTTNAILDRDGQKRNYLQVFIVRGFICIVYSIWFLSNKDLTFDYSAANSLQLLLLWLPILTFEVCSYWLTFEIILNALRHNPILYYDHQEGDSGYVDRFFKWAGFEVHFISKCLCLVATIWAIIKLYHNGY